MLSSHATFSLRWLLFFKNYSQRACAYLQHKLAGWRLKRESRPSQHLTRTSHLNRNIRTRASFHATQCLQPHMRWRACFCWLHDRT